MRFSLAFLFAICIADISLAVPIEFLVAEPPPYRVHGDSYLITIDSEDTGRLNHARALIGWIDSGADPAASPGATIVVANLIAGSDGINRDALAVGQPLWTWHTASPIDFTDFTIEILDGTPTMVENDIPAWFANTNGAIGFWSYTVVAELGAVPEPSGGALAMGLIPLLLTGRRRNGLCVQAAK